MDNRTKTIKVSADIEDITEWIRIIKGELTENPPPRPWYISFPQSFSQFIQNHKLWVTVFLFLCAWLLYGANPLYPIKIWASASEELEAKIEQQVYQSALSGFYIEMGNRFLTLGKFKDAQGAFEEARKLNRNSKQAEFGFLKSKLLDFSADNEFDAQIIASRIELLDRSKLDPNVFDLHIAYAKALLMSQNTNKDEELVALLFQILDADEHHAAALGLLASVYLRQGKYDDAIPHLKKALGVAKQSVNYRMNLSYAHEKKGDYKTAYGYLQEAHDADTEAFLPILEITRFSLLYFHNFEVVQQNCEDTIAQFESYDLHQSPKNKAAKVRYVIDSRDYFISHWAIKKAYCRQLAVFSRHLIDLSRGENAVTGKIDAELRKIWEGEFQAKKVLPIFLMNDLNSLVSADQQTFEPIVDQLRSVYSLAQSQVKQTRVTRLF